MSEEEAAPDLVRRNIERVLRLEEHASRSRGPIEAIADFTGRFVGTFAFVCVQLLVIGGWIVWNSGVIPGLVPFDRFPFNLLSAVTSAEAVILSAFVLMKQNRMSSIADRRDHLDLQVNLMAEQEASIIIQMLDRISRKLEITQDGRKEALELSNTSTLDHLVEQLHARYPDAEGELPKAERDVSG